jgi:predicted nuclease of predicted toxin-antitoxin system
VKLRLDEMYSHVIAEQLRARGHDADAVVEHAELRGRADTDIFALAQAEQRAVVTENISDFSDIATEYDQRGEAHYGVVLADRRSYPRSDSRLVGHMVTALERLLGEHTDTVAESQRHWL